MTFTRTSLPPVVRLGGSTDVPAIVSSSSTSMSIGTSVVRPTIVRIEMMPGAEVEPVDDGINGTAKRNTALPESVDIGQEPATSP